MMKFNKKQGWAIVGVFVLSACATSGSRFGKIYPGMTSDQVVQTMGKGPDKTDAFPDNYASWYFGQDACILVQNDKVVGKSVSEEKGVLETFGYGGMSEKKKAECIPPGYKPTNKVERSIETPFGTIKR